MYFRAQLSNLGTCGELVEPYRSRGFGASTKKWSGVSGAGHFEEPIIELGFFDFRRRLLFRRRARGLFLPESAVLQNLPYYRVLIDKRYDLHRTAALRAFQRVNFINAFYQRSPCHSAFSTKRRIRFLLAGRSNGLRGRALDNVFVERLWRSVKYEDIYLKDYGTPRDALRGLTSYFRFYNHERPHQSLGNRTPAEVFYAAV